MSDAVEAIVMFAIAAGLVWLTFFSRSRGAKGWWGYLLTVPIILYLAISAAAGHPVGGHAR